MKRSCAMILCAVLCFGFITPGLGQTGNTSGTQAAQSGSSVQAATPSEPTAAPEATEQPALPAEPARADHPVDYGTWISTRFRIEAPDAYERLQSYSEEEAGEGEALARITYPYEWPSRYLHGALPEYKGQGWIADLRIIYPAWSTEAEYVRSLSWTMYEYKPEELEAFLLSLREAGYAESTDEEMIARMREAYAPVATSYGLLVKDGVQFHYYTAQNGPMVEGLLAEMTLPEDIAEAQREAVESVKKMGSGDYVHFALDFLDKKEPDLAPDKDTQLQSVKDATPDEVLMDEVYEDGIREVAYGAPSAWPKGVVANLIPEYTLAGTLAIFQVTALKDKPERESMLTGTLYIKDAPESAFEHYAEQLVAHGYRRMAPEQYHSEDAEIVQKLKECAVFFYPGLRCYLGIQNQTGDDVLVILLKHDGRLMEIYN